MHSFQLSCFNWKHIYMADISIVNKYKTNTSQTTVITGVDPGGF